MLLIVGVAGPALAQGTIERIPNPQPIEVWQPSSGQPSRTQPATQGNPDPYSPIRPPLGIDVGNGITWYPGITVGAFYDDNVFATNSNKVADWAAVVRPELGVRSVGPNHLVQAQAFVEAREYRQQTTENQVNGAAAVASTYQPDPTTQLQSRLRYVHAHEDRGASESLVTVRTLKPIAYDLFEAGGAINKRLTDRWWTSVGAAGTWIDYQDGTTVAGVPVPQNYRDGTISVASWRVGTVVAPFTSVFLEVSGNRRDFKVDMFDSTGYRFVGGWLLEPGQGTRVRGEVFAGYMRQTYAGVGFQTVSTWTYGAGLGFIITPELTAVVEGRRLAAESALLPGSVVETLFAARLDYRVLTNLVVGGGFSYLEDQFYGADRTDKSWSPLASVKWLVNPNVTVGFDYRNVSFDSQGGVLAGLPYDRNVYLISLNAKL